MADLVALPSHVDFTTDDPEVLKEELQREHEEVRAAIIDAGPVRPWREVLPPSGTTEVAAAPYDMIVCLAFDLTVRPPVDAEPGTVFRVVRADVGNVTLFPNDGTTANGAASDTLNTAGYREYMFSNGGWWLNNG